jgi:hypothetical protein
MMFLSIVFALLFGSVTARPDGSPVCTVGSAAPSGAHLTRNASITVTGPLSQGNFAVSIGGLTLSSSGFNNVTSDTNLNLELTSTNGGVFKGVLIILNEAGVNLTSSLTTNSTLLKTQALCPPDGYGGFTHTSRDLKTSASGTINMPANLEAFLDVNVVVVNNSTAGSTYFYTRFQLSTVKSTAPVAAPVAPPITAPVAAPVAPPITAPVAAPVAVPIKAPVEVPVVAPKAAPVPVPVTVVAPVSANVTSAPVVAPTDAPSRKSCGLFGLSILCIRGCGLARRILGFC